MNLHYEESGNEEAPLMLFMHGGGVSSWMWDEQVRHFQRYHCVTVDLPGHGQSPVEEVFSIERVATAVIELVEKLADGKEIIVAGFSLGAQILVKMLTMRPNLIDAAVVNSATVKPAVIDGRWIKPLVTMSFPLIRNRTFAKLQAQTMYIGEEHFDKYYEESAKMKLETLLQILQENMSFSMPASFARAAAKVLVTVGEKEGRRVKQSAAKLASSNPNCTMLMFSGIGHGAMLANPKLFNEAVGKWIAETMHGV